MNYYDTGYVQVMQVLGIQKEAGIADFLRSAVGMGRKVVLPAAPAAVRGSANRKGLLAKAFGSRPRAPAPTQANKVRLPHPGDVRVRPTGTPRVPRPTNAPGTPMDPQGILATEQAAAAGSGLPFGLSKTQLALGGAGAGGAGVLGYNVYQGSQPQAPEVARQLYGNEYMH